MHRLALLTVTSLLLALPLAGCGGDDSDDASPATTATATETETTGAAVDVDLDGVKSYLTDHTEKLASATADFQALAAEYDALAKQVERGDRAAKERMVNSNLRLVVSLAKRYQGHGVSLGDLIQDGVIEPIDETVAALRAVTAADVQRVATRVIGPRQFSMAVVGPSASADRLATIIGA